MVHLDFPQREMAIKLVYYGPARSGKTTNLKQLHDRVDAGVRGRLMSLDTTDDRTLFFDLLPIFFKTDSGLSIRVKMYTVPGQVIHNATRKLVLTGADGIVFVADSQVSETRANNESFANLKANLREIGLDLAGMPLVLQFNKRDLGGVRSDAEIDGIATKGKEPVFRASALSGDGVVETFVGLTRLVWSHLNRKFELESKFGIAKAQFFAEIERYLAITPEEMARAEKPLGIASEARGGDKR